MEPKLLSEAIAQAISERFPDEVIEIREFRGQVSVTVRKERVKEILTYLRSTPQFSFNHLQDVTGVDYLGRKALRFEVVYHLFSISHRHSIRIKAEVGQDDPSIDSVVDIWQGANWPERECYDLMGIRFNGHPDLRRVLLPEDWEGHPLRKDYPLKSDLGERDWKGFKEVVATAQRNRQYEIREVQ